MRACLVAFTLIALTGCDNPSVVAADAAAASPPLPRRSLERPTPSDAADARATVTDAAAPTWHAAMPARPVPKTTPTVNASMPADVQMQAIAYMTAMTQPHPDDAPADPKYAEQLAEQLKPIVLSFDKGTSDQKQRLNRVEVIAAGRRIDLLMAQGCDAQLPARAVVQRAGVSWTTLRGHGVLVLRCNDAHAQCLQSTRDPSDVLCTTAPRHR